MKKMKASSSLRLIAFFLVATILVCAFGFSADGWQLKSEGASPAPQQSTQKPATNNTPLPENGNNTETPPQPEPPKFYNYLTGEETTEELSSLRHTAFVLNPAAPMYGISSSDLIIEFPIEDGSTRLLSFINDPTNIAKIGSLASNRNYITNLAVAFGATLFSIGNDDTVEYSKCSVDEKNIIDTDVTNYIYTEFARFSYTSGALVNDAFATNGYINSKAEIPCPFLFNQSDDTPIKGDSIFNEITIPYSASSKTVLSYSHETATYFLEKNSSKMSDMATSSAVDFTNCFVLFADSVTYENQSSTQMVLSTMGHGTGYYFTKGTAKQITWSLSEDGRLVFLDDTSNELIVNKGKTFISFVKSSQISDITLS